jgi:hypothetical protein
MPITIDGSGTITGLSAGGLPDSSIVTADIADANITAAKLDGAQSGSAPIYAARAWVNFNGTGTVAIRASGNVSSITDNGTGNYTVNFTTAMPDANYSLVQGGGEVNTSTLYSGSTAARIMQPGVLSASNAQFFTGYQYSSSALQDAAYIYLAVFR